MDAETVDEFGKHYAVVRELFDRLPSVRDDAEVYRLTWAELKKHLAKLEELSPPATEPLYRGRASRAGAPTPGATHSRNVDLLAPVPSVVDPGNSA